MEATCGNGYAPVRGMTAMMMMMILPEPVGLDSQNDAQAWPAGST